MSTDYDAFDDPYAYPGTTVLRNKLDLRSASRLEAFETEMAGIRSQEESPGGTFDPRHYCRVHHHLFQDVYAWAGAYRTVRTSKGGNTFCFPENIEREMNRLFALAARLLNANNDEMFTNEAARFLAELNAIHPFREGNGRTQLTFMSMLGKASGFPLDLGLVRHDSFLPAMIKSYSGDLRPLVDELRLLRTV